MTNRRSLFGVVAALAVAFAGCAVHHPQGTKPWEQPGTSVGEEIIGPDGAKMVWVPAGEFTMGSSAAEVARAAQSLPAEAQRQRLFDNEQPAHRVQITRGFWLGKRTVTNAQYRRYCQETGANPREVLDEGGGDHPVQCVSWDKAQAYCRHYGLRLPTEAEWEYAARGPNGRRYPWGSEWDPKKCCNGDNQGPGGHAFPVGSFPEGASWCGALDMAGNVSQWCQDWLSDGYYATSPGSDPVGPSRGEYRAVRGGYWADSPMFLRCAHRSGCRPSRAIEISVGIRCAR